MAPSAHWQRSQLDDPFEDHGLEFFRQRLFKVFDPLVNQTACIENNINHEKFQTKTLRTAKALGYLDVSR